jgi:hypothetical protein
MVCDHNDTWAVFSDTDTEPTEEEQFCPQAGHPAVGLSRNSLDRDLRITIAAAGGAPSSQSDRSTEFFIELSTWDGVNRLLSTRTYSWEDALKRVELFHNLSWEDAERRWKHLRMSASNDSARDPRMSAAEARRGLSASLAQIAEEIRTGTRTVENNTAAELFAAAAAWLDDMDGYYRSQGREPYKESAWLAVGEVFKAALDYE